LVFSGYKAREDERATGRGRNHKEEKKRRTREKEKLGLKLKPRLETGAERRRKHLGAELRNP
jgi:hypothetical protein